MFTNTVVLGRLLAKIGASELLVLPAGFVRVGTEGEARLRAAQIADLCRGRAAVAFGVDLIGAIKGWRNLDPLLRFFGYLARKDGSRPLWHVRQLAATSQQRVEAGRLLKEQRIASIGRTRVGLLVCGEMMGGLHGKGANGRRLRTMADGADLVVDVAHADIKVGSSPRTWSVALRDTAKYGNRQVLIAHHVSEDKLKRRLKTFFEKRGPKLLAGRRTDWLCRRQVPSLCAPKRVAAYLDLYECAV